jgi:hypothetical protein
MRRPGTPDADLGVHLGKKAIQRNELRPGDGGVGKVAGSVRRSKRIRNPRGAGPDIIRSQVGRKEMQDKMQRRNLPGRNQQNSGRAIRRDWDHTKGPARTSETGMGRKNEGSGTRSEGRKKRTRNNRRGRGRGRGTIVAEH